MAPAQTPAPQRIGLLAAIALVVGNMIGSGVFLLPASLAPLGWNAVFGWLITIAGTLILAWLLAVLTQRKPEARDPMGFVDAGFGEFAAFLVGWIYWVSVWTGIASISVAAVSYLSAIVPQIEAAPFGPAACAIALIWAMTLINLRGARTAGRFQIATVLLKTLPLLAVIIVAAAAIGGGMAEVQPLDPGDLNGADLRAAAALTLFALLGFECASLAAARVENPQVNVPKATLWGTGLTGVLYLLVCSAVGLMLPEAVAANSPAPLATFVERYWSAEAAALVTVFAIVSCVGAVNGWVLIQGEMPRNMAERAMVPQWFGHTDSRGTPVNALLLSSAIATVCLLLNASRSMQGIYEFILLLSTSSALWLYLACALSAWRMRIARPAALVGAGYAFWTLWGAGFEASGWSLVLMLSGLPFFLWAKRHPPASQNTA